MRVGIILIGTVCISPALADKLPRDAVPLASADVTGIYSGKSQMGKMSDVYFAPDGTTLGIAGKPKVKTVFAGTWRVAENEMCMDNVAKIDGKTYTDCNKFWRRGETVYSLWSKHFDGSKVDVKSGYWTKQLMEMKPGDLVSERYRTAGGQ